MSEQILKISIQGDASDASASLTKVRSDVAGLGEELATASAAGKAAGAEIDAGMQEADYSMMEARHTAMMLGEEVGVRIPRAVAGMLASIGPVGAVMSAAFPILGALALIQIIGDIVDKFSDSSAAAQKNAKQWQDMGHEMQESQSKANQELAKTIAEVDKIKTPGAVGQLRALEAEMNELSHASSTLGKSLEDVIDKEAEMAGKETLTDRIGNTLQAVFSYIPGLQSLASAYHNTHMEELDLADDAKEFGDKLRTTLDTEGTAAGLKAVDQELDRVYAALQKNPGNAALERYKTTLEGVQHALASETTETFWKEQKIGAEEATQRTDLLLQVHKALGQAITETGKISSASETEATKIIDAALKQQLSEEQKLGEATLKNADSQLKLNEAIAKSAVDRQADIVAQDRAEGKTSKMIADQTTLIGLLKKQEDAELAIVDAKIAEAQAAMQIGFASGGLESPDFQNAEAQYRDYQAQRIQIAAQADKQIAEASAKTEAEMLQFGRQYLGQFNDEFASAFANVASGHETLGKAAAKMYESMEMSMLQFFAKWAMKEGEKRIMSALTHSQEASEQATSAAAQKSITSTTNVSEATSNAAVAATGAAASMAAVPFAGPELALGAASTMQASLSPFISLAAFDTGGMSEGGLSLLHPREAVLNPVQTENFQRMTEDGGGDTHHHHYNSTVNAMDSHSFENYLKRNPAALSAGIMHASKNGHLSARELARGK